MTEVGQCAGDAIVAPRGVLLGHADDVGFDGNIDAWAPRVGTTLRAVELAGDQPTIPGQDGVWFGNTGNLCKMFPAKALGDLGKCRPLWIGEPKPPGDVRAEDSILRDQVFALEEQALVYQARNVRQ